VRRVLWIVLALNVSCSLTKLVLSSFVGSVSLFADGVHAVLDGFSNVVGLIGIAIASQPPDANHPYGHRRFETLASVVVGIFIAAGLWKIGSSVVDALMGHRTTPQVSWLSAGIVAGTIVINIFITRYEAKRGKELSSAILLADAGHTLADSWGALAVLASFAGVALGFVWADLAAAVIVGGLIARTAFGVLVPNVRSLADEARLDAKDVLSVALAVEGIRGAHKIRSRGSIDHVHVDLHIQVDAHITIEDAHALTHKVADAIRKAFPTVHDVVIHTEPADGREGPSPILPS
jgi:cation diffusion facilitator family transporter